MKKIFFIAFVIGSLYAQSQTARTYSNEFLNIGVSARALAMGNSVVAQTTDVTSGYWNPAGLSNVHNQQISLMHAAYFANIANLIISAMQNP